jgi:phosphoribosylaminoimidazolecarboxamide formyltransferase/IMP cyclohydrolase
MVILASGAGSLAQALIDAVREGSVPGSVVAVGADREAPVLQVAADASIATFTVNPADFPSREVWDTALTRAVAAFTPDLVISAGFMRVLGADFLARFEGKTLNTHPALLPRFPGAHAVRDALAAGVKETGCTIHWVDAGVDTGPVIAQRRITVLPGDDASTLHERIKVAERAMLIDTVAGLARGAIAFPTPPGEAPAPARIPVRRALVSVYNKSGLAELAAALHAAGVEVVSTGSTAAHIEAAGVPVARVEDVTGSPECLDGRVKTLHPRIHAGLLADLRRPEHAAQLQDLEIEPFGLVVANLYPFTETVAAGASPEECVEQIDIGGPAMVRAAAKNHASVAIVTDPSRYAWAAAQVAAGGFTLTQRERLAREAFRHTATYDVAVATWMSSQFPDDGAPTWRGATWEAVASLRYGENPHQDAQVWAAIGGGDCLDTEGGEVTGLPQGTQLGGKAMSYNNYVDADAARRAALDFPEPAVAIIKHANPCGIAVGTDAADAHAKAHACDPISAYGGVIAVNRPVTLAMAEAVKPIFTEVIVAPDYEPQALELLRAKTSLRILRVPVTAPPAWETRMIAGGALTQRRDLIDAPGDHPDAWSLVAGAAADPAVLADLVFAWRAVRAVKSNAILLAKDQASVGIGMGQVNRVDAAHLAVRRAGPERAQGAVAASDAFFPFPDGLEILLAAGVRAVVHPGGSIRDAEVIAAAREAGVTMYLTGTRHFAH